MDEDWYFLKAVRGVANVFIASERYPLLVYAERGKKHRVGGPAIECASGDRWWYENNNLHRVGGPAVEYASGNRLWSENGKIHRVGGPAIECTNGNEAWWENGKRTRVGGGPAI